MKGSKFEHLRADGSRILKLVISLEYVEKELN